MDGEKAHMIYSDPPYNIGLDYNKGVEGKSNYGGKYSGAKDSMKEENYAEFIDKTLFGALKHTKKDAHIFYWCDEAYIWVMQQMYIEHKIKNQRVCLWIKNNAFPKPQVAFNKCYEPCVYGVRGKPYLNKDVTKLNEILNKEVESGNQIHDQIQSYFTLWIEKKDDTSAYLHPTQKPISLHEKPLKRCTGQGHIVLDLFGGSGSTLMACQQLGRKARLMELDPVFATVILDRWEEATGLKAKKIS
jgi:DNA modification methylase